MTNRINTLTGLRFFAALAIILHHLPGHLWLQDGAFMGAFLDHGVSFFFVLSGFILQHSYRRRLRSGITTAQFIALRFFRLWPCHIAVIALLLTVNGKFLLDYILQTYSVGQILSAVFLLQAWNLDLAVYALNGPAWAISVEMFLYALFPLLCRQALLSALRPALIGAAITGGWLTTISLYIPDGDLAALTMTFPLARVFEFSIGISTYEYFSKRSFRSGTLFEVGTLVLVFLAIISTPHVFSFFYPHVGVLAWWLGRCFSFWSFAILLTVFFWQQGKLSSFVSWRPVVYLGEISFALYLVHQPVIGLFQFQFAPWFHKLPLAVQIIMFAVIVLGLSSALYHIVEKPCMKIAKRLIS